MPYLPYSHLAVSFCILATGHIERETRFRFFVNFDLKCPIGCPQLKQIDKRAQTGLAAWCLANKLARFCYCSLADCVAEDRLGLLFS